jgi:cytochrome c oxidase subunit 2
MAAVVLIVVLSALWLAMRGPSRVRASLAGTGVVYLGGLAFPAVVLTGLLGYNFWLTAATARAPGEDAIGIELTGEQWWWRVAYFAADGERIAAANEIRVPVGREISFVLRSADVIHSFWVPSLGGKVDMIPGRTTHLTLGADRPGIYRGQCAEYCGGAHALMAVTVIAMPAPEFEAWLASEAAPPAEPATEAGRNGRSLFLAAGCGGCHTIRGTSAAGTIGPDLTHLGSRRSVGVDTLPLSQENVARFIVDGQHIKPNNAMPAFHIFSAAELGDLAIYLTQLK